MSKENGIYVFVIDRSDLSKHSTFIPPNNPNYPQYPNGKSFTYLEEIRTFPNRYWRKDIGLVNLCFVNGETESLTIDADTNGNLVAWNKDVLNYFTKQQMKEMKTIAKKMADIAKSTPEMNVFLVKAK